jgi:hypothetical protein
VRGSGADDLRSPYVGESEAPLPGFIASGVSVPIKRIQLPSSTPLELRMWGPAPSPGGAADLQKDQRNVAIHLAAHRTVTP